MILVRNVKVILLVWMLFCCSFLRAQNYDEVNYPMKAFGSDLNFGFLGGLTNPVFGTTDFNMDGVQDLIVFDRNGDRLYTFLHTGEVGEPNYIHEPFYEKSFPALTSWAQFRDYNGDGIIDIFTSASESASSVAVYTGRHDGTLSFERKTFPDDPQDFLYYDYVSPTTGNILRFNITVLFGDDIPEIVDLDGDGDLDFLTFDSGGTTVNLYQNLAVENNLGNDALYFLEERCWGKFKEAGLDAEIFLSSNPNLCSQGFVGHGDESSDRHSGSNLCCFDGDGDGDLDILIGDIGSSHMIYLTNGGTPTMAYMTESEELFPINNVSIEQFVFPAAFYVDVDNDSRRDLIVAPSNRESGINKDHIWFYKNTGSDNSPIFDLTARNFLINNSINIGRYTHPTFLDYNADGLQDILVGSSGYRLDSDEIEVGLHLFENIGTLTSPSFELVDDDYLSFSQLSDFSIRLAPAVGDLDGDGDDDLIIGDNNGKLYHFKNNGGANQPYNFNGYTYEYMGIDVGSDAKPQIFDINKDGLMDLVIGESNTNQNASGVQGQINYFENTGSVGNPLFVGDVTAMPNNNALGGFTGLGLKNIAPIFYDAQDETLLFAGSDDGDLVLFDGIESVESIYNLKNESIGNLNIGRNSVPALADIDGDGYLEVLIGNRRGGLDFYNTTFSINGIDTKVSDVSKIYDMKLYPNPTSGYLHIDTDENIVMATVFNIQGVRLKSFSQGFNNLDLSELSNGTYIVQIILDNLSTVNKKIVITKL